MMVSEELEDFVVDNTNLRINPSSSEALKSFLILFELIIHEIQMGNILIATDKLL